MAWEMGTPRMTVGAQHRQHEPTLPFHDLSALAGRQLPSTDDNSQVPLHLGGTRRLVLIVSRALGVTSGRRRQKDHNYSLPLKYIVCNTTAPDGFLLRESCSPLHQRACYSAITPRSTSAWRQSGNKSALNTMCLINTHKNRFLSHRSPFVWSGHIPDGIAKSPARANNQTLTLVAAHSKCSGV